MRGTTKITTITKIGEELRDGGLSSDGPQQNGMFSSEHFIR